MPSFHFSLVSPEKLLFTGQVDQVDVPGIEGDFGVLSGHAPIVAVVRPGVVTAMAGTAREKFVLYGGLAEFAGEELTILADSATTVEEIDIAEFKTRIEEMQQAVQTMSPGEELDRALALLDHYKSIRITLASTTAF
jgi:F-type H+-transporting ATPase subunit epsilon